MESSAAAGSNRKKVHIDTQKGKELRERLSKFERQFQKSQEDFQFGSDTMYHLISTKFIEEWKEFCTFESPERVQPSPLNIDLFEPDGQSLRKGLQEGADFQIVNNEVAELFKQYKGKRLHRQARMVGNDKKVQIYLSRYNYLPLSNSDLNKIDNRNIGKQEFIKSLKSIQQSEQATITQFCATIVQSENWSQYCKIRVWKLEKEVTLSNIYDHILQKCKNLSSFYDYKIKFMGKRLDDVDTKLCDLNMVQGDFFVIEFKQSAKDWYLQADNEGKCEGCYNMKELPFPCACKKVAYCTESCKEKDKRYHYNKCSAAEQEEINQKVQMSFTSKSLKGLVGLNNLGNTCFMNSCLQCLSHTMPLTQYFIKSCYEGEMNRENVLGSKGKLAKCYAKFIKAMWCDSESTFSPYNLKSAVSNINPIFSGYSQHDSQQFFSFIVDGLHEDLNRVKKKPYVQSVQSKGRQDKVVALESWIAYIKRNQSIIVDLMTGQYKSKVTCPDCKHESITFDPFTTVTLPIPQQVTNTLDFFAIFHNFERETMKMSFTYKKMNVEEWHRKAGELIKVDPKLVRLYVLTMYEGIYGIRSCSQSEIIQKIENENKNVFVIELSEEEANFKNPIQFTTRFSKKSQYYNSFESMWFKFPFFFEMTKISGLVIYKRILRFLYNESYDDSTKRASDGKSYQEYEKLMLKNRPFELVLRYQKKLEKYYHRTEYKFESERIIKDDMDLVQILEGTNIKDCQLDARFQIEGLRNFTIENLKKFKDTTTSWGRKGESTEDATVTLEQCFDILREPEKLEPGNEWFCSNCKDHKLATKEIDIYKAPKILIIHLKRFKQKGSYRKQKNQSKVIFPMSLDLSSYLIDPSPMSTYRNQAVKQDVYIKPTYEQEIMSTTQTEYELYAVSNHYGGLGGGHYTACGKNNGKWYDFNDSSVRSTSESSVCSSGAYILFYKRKD